MSAGLTESRELAKFQLDAEEKKKKVKGGYGPVRQLVKPWQSLLSCKMLDCER